MFLWGAGREQWGAGSNSHTLNGVDSCGLKYEKMGACTLT